MVSNPGWGGGIIILFRLLGTPNVLIIEVEVQ